MFGFQTHTVDVRIPDVRFGYPDKNMSGFRHIRLSDVRFIPLYPVFRRPIDLERLKTGRYIRFKRPKTGRYIRFSDVLEPKPVWNQFRTGLEPVLVDSDVISGFQTLETSETSENRTLYPVFRRFRTSGSLNSNSRNLLCPITGRLCPVFRRFIYIKRPKTGYNCMNRTSDNRIIR